jgi:hypothetical protein
MHCRSSVLVKVELCQTSGSGQHAQTSTKLNVCLLVKSLGTQNHKDIGCPATMVNRVAVEAAPEILCRKLHSTHRHTLHPSIVQCEGRRKRPTRVRALTNTFTVRPPILIAVVVEPVEAAPEMLCCFPAVACPGRVSFPLLPCLDAIPVAVASLGLTLRLCTGQVPI